MIVVLVTYRAYFGKTADVKEIVSRFVAHVKKQEPDTISYEVYQDKKDDHVFYHLMKFKNAKAERAHRTSSYVKTFSDELFPFCQTEPKFQYLKSF